MAAIEPVWIRQQVNLESNEWVRESSRMTGSTQTSQSNTAQSASPQFDEYEFCVFLVGQLQSVKLTPVVQGISLEFSSEVKKRGFLGASFYISFALRG